MVSAGAPTSDGAVYEKKGKRKERRERVERVRGGEIRRGVRR
jgi:hypothetical protein